jgi:hypothetical protein
MQAVRRLDLTANTHTALAATSLRAVPIGASDMEVSRADHIIV